MIPADPGGRFSPILSWMLLLDPVVDELADHPARDRPDGDRREQRRREQPDREPDPAAPARPLAAEVVARLAHRDAPVLGVRDEDDALDRDLASRLTSATSASKSFVASSMSW